MLDALIRSVARVSRTCIKLSVITAVAVHGGAAWAQDKVTLKTVTPFTTDNALSRPTVIFKELVEKASNGRIEVQILGGPEVVPPTNQFEALRNGVIQVLHATVPYYSGTVPEATVLNYTRRDAKEMRENGLFDLLRKVHRDRANVQYLALGGGEPGEAFRFYLKKPLSEKGLEGLRIRVSPLTASVTKAVGAQPVSIPVTDLQTALERGVIDGVALTSIGAIEFGITEDTKYVLDHGFFSANAPILVNGSTWDSLPPDVKQILEKVAPEFEAAVFEYQSQLLSKENERLKQAGLKFVKLPGNKADGFVAKIVEAGWADYLENASETKRQLYELAK